MLPLALRYVSSSLPLHPDIAPCVPVVLSPCLTAHLLRLRIWGTIGLLTFLLDLYIFLFVCVSCFVAHVCFQAMGVSIKLKQLIQHVTDAMRSFTGRVDPIKRQPAGTSAAWAGLHAADAANVEASTIRVDALWSDTVSCVEARGAVFDNLRSSQKNIASAITSIVQDRCTFLRSLKI